MSVSLSVCMHIKTARPCLPEVVITLCTSGFVDDVGYAHNGQERAP